MGFLSHGLLGTRVLGLCFLLAGCLSHSGYCQYASADDKNVSSAPQNGGFPQIALPPMASITSAHLLQLQSNNTDGDQRNGTYIRLVPRNRIDPLNHFKRYRAGYDIKSKHYWASTIFTGVPGYAIGAIWLLIGLVYVICLLISCFFCRRKRKISANRSNSVHSRRYYVWPFFGVLFLTFSVIFTTCFVLGGNSVLHKRAKRVERTIIGAADGATDTIYNVTSTMKLMQDYLEPYDTHAYTRLNTTAAKLDAEAANIHNQVYDNKHAIDLGLKLLFVLTTVLVSVNMALAVFAIAVLLLHWRKTLFLIIIVCWLLTTVIWLGFGLYFAIHKFADDSCIALSDYERNPYSNTTLEEILPCVDLEEAESSLTESRQAVHVLIGELNRNISRFSRLSGGLINIPHICDPFTGAPDYEYKPESCPNNTIQIGNLTDVLKSYLCSGNTSNCTIGEFISEATFKEAEAYTKAIQSLLDIFPQLQSLANCSFVKDTFSTIVNRHCKPVKSSVNMTWRSLVGLATITLFLVLAWIAKAYQNSGRQFAKGSVIPHEVPYLSPASSAET